MESLLIFIVPLVAGFMLDIIFGDPSSWPHPIVAFGKVIAKADRFLNNGHYRFIKGALATIILTSFVFFIFTLLEMAMLKIHLSIAIIWSTIVVFWGLAHQTLIREGKAVFDKLEQEGIEAARKQLSRIVGRETGNLSEDQVKKAVFETLAENLSDGVIAPLFYYMLAGPPGMMAYKMVNTLDSMIGYKNDKYHEFGKFAARLDDFLNYIPARLTAFLMVVVTASPRGFRFIIKYGNKHASPNAGFPEAALAGILDCRFGGPHYYFGQLIEKPFIGENPREIKQKEIRKVININQAITMVFIFLQVFLTSLAYIV